MTQPAPLKRLEIRLFATLRENRGKILFREFREGLSVADVLATLEISLQDVAIILVNGRDAPHGRLLKEGDILSIFPPVGGG